MSETAEFYKVHKGYEWAHIFIDEKTGTFSAVSSFGNFAHIWNHIGGDTLKQFLAGLDYDYFFRKTAHTRGRVFSHEETVKGIKQSLIERRRQSPKALSKELIREAFRDLDNIDTIGSADHFFHELTDSSDLMEALDGDYYDVSREADDPQCRGFWDKIWPEFLAQVRRPLPAPPDASPVEAGRCACLDEKPRSSMCFLPCPENERRRGLTEKSSTQEPTP